MIRRHHADAISPFAAKFAAIRPYEKKPAVDG
jgi:hypothetical protein